MPENKKETETPPPSDTTDHNAKEESEDTKKDKPIKSEDNTFSQEEMKNLESKESKVKTSLVDRIFKKNVKPPAEETNKDKNKEKLISSNTDTPENEIKTLKKDMSGTTSRLDSMSITVEKLEGKIENERAVATGTEERISRLSEEIGELRSMILDRERGYNEMETGFKKIEAMTEEMQPEIIKKDLDKKEREIIQIIVKQEQLDATSSETNKQIKLFREQMNKIKSLDNLLKVSKNIEDKISKIKDTERYTGRMAAKTEELFTELDKRITRFSSQSTKIDSIDELTKELMESFDKTEVKLKEAVFKEDLEKLKQSINSSNQKSKDTELTNIKSDLSSLQDNFNKLKSNFELLNLDTLTNRNPNIATIEKTQKKATEKLPSLEDIISEKKLSKLRKEIEEQTKKIEELSISISELKNSNSLQNNLTNELKRSYETLPSTINTKTNEKTKELKNNITQITNLISIMQKNEHTTKNDIETIKKQTNEKTKEILNIEQTIQQRIKKEIELLKKTEEDTKEKLKKEFNQKINELNTNTKPISDTITNIQDNMKYLEDSINTMKQPPSKQAINAEINEKTKELKNSIAQLTNTLSIMQKKEHSSKQDIDDLKKEINKKINEITENRKKDNTIQQRTKKEIELLKKTEEDTKEKLKKEFNQKINELNTNTKPISDTITNIQDNMKYLEDSINTMKQPPSKQAINAEINEKTKELKNNISQIANILTIMQKKEHSSKQDIDDLKKEINKKINEITETTLKDDTTKQKTKKEIELMKKNEEETREKLRKEFNQKIYKLNTNIKQTYNTTANLQDKMRYMEDSINTMKQPPSKQTINTEINEKTKELKNNISQIANILSIMQKKEHSSKQDIDDLKKEINKKINEITETTLKDDTTKQKTKKEIELMKKNEEETREKLRKEFNQKIYKLNTNIKQTYNTTANIQDNMKYMKDSRNTMKQPPSRQVISTDTNTTGKRINKNIIPDTKKTAIDDSDKAKHNFAKQGIIQMSYEELLNEDINQLLYQNVTPVYEQDLRLNKVIRLIDKTEELLNKNNHKEAKKTYDDLVSAYNTICKKVPQSQIEEIYPLIEQLHNKLKSVPS